MFLLTVFSDSWTPVRKRELLNNPQPPRTRGSSWGCGSGRNVTVPLNYFMERITNKDSDIRNSDNVGIRSKTTLKWGVSRSGLGVRWRGKRTGYLGPNVNLESWGVRRCLCVSNGWGMRPVYLETMEWPRRDGGVRQILRETGSRDGRPLYRRGKVPGRVYS